MSRLWSCLTFYTCIDLCLAMLMLKRDEWSSSPILWKRFWAPDGDRTCNLLMTGETLLPLSYGNSDGELRCKFDIYVQPKRKPLYINNDWCKFCLRNVRAWIYLNMSPVIRRFAGSIPVWGSESFSKYRAWQSFISLKIYPSSHVSQTKSVCLCLS